MARKYHLHRALIHVYAQGMRDFVSPLAELLDIVYLSKRKDLMPPHPSCLTAGNVEPSSDMSLEGVLFLYVKCALSGLSFPSRQPMDAAVAYTARSSVLRFIFGLDTPGADSSPSPVDPTVVPLTKMLALQFLQTISLIQTVLSDPALRSLPKSLQKKRNDDDVSAVPVVHPPDNAAVYYVIRDVVMDMTTPLNIYAAQGQTKMWSPYKVRQYVCMYSMMIRLHFTCHFTYHYFVMAYSLSILQLTLYHDTYTACCMFLMTSQLVWMTRKG